MFGRRRSRADARETLRRIPCLIKHTALRDRLSERVDLLAVEVRLRRESDHVVITRRADRRIDRRVITLAHTR